MYKQKFNDSEYSKFDTRLIEGMPDKEKEFMAMATRFYWSLFDIAEKIDGLSEEERAAWVGAQILLMSYHLNADGQKMLCDSIIETTTFDGEMQ